MSEVQAISTLVEASAMRPSILTDARKVQHAFIPDGGGRYRREQLTPDREIVPQPQFIEQYVNVDQVSALVEYVNRFKVSETVIFADLAARGRITAAIDYHKAGSAGAGLVRHRATLNLVHSAEWMTWQSINGKMFDQKAFARMIDINSADISKPPAATLLEMVLDLEMHTQVSVARRLEGSGTSRGNSSVGRTTAGTVLPSTFTLLIPVFTGEPPVEVVASTKDEHDLEKNKISIGLELVRTRIIIEDELSRIAEEIAKATGVPVIMGSI